ncbi:hypothetical protein ATO6_11910 [Oceanicola sp. 22II-s10i]|uniref:chemotaxis protein CheB n=1 Tax=Oceanicola sp. 22II-s10i TaxID=1317116 RepID=UPI000B752D32|nr:chemotaxis protein CheB [Oceanicola sp. 22II-s10i]OWU84408.1 hypothetical protein ATO6_11910 [Oceanicola sp. 22II-s10i]
MADDSELPWIVGIAASAGGLEAISAFVRDLPPRTGACYVIAQHLSPSHKSLMSTLVARETELPVRELQDGDAPEPDTIYITPPSRDVILSDGALRLVDPAGGPGTPKPSVDRLFYSLADEGGEKCIAIVLSGTGSDGSYGVQAVREAGGITIAQDQATAKYDGMPASAVETGCIDLVLTPEQISEHITEIMASPRDLTLFKRAEEKDAESRELMQILLARTQVDFREYKDTTIQRRIKRRMTALRITAFDQYIAHCRTNSKEVDALFRDLLISVTRFFRDPGQFERLGMEIRQIIEARDEGEPLRIWVAGCATGEEVYTIAMLIVEACGGPGQIDARMIQIFATDIDENALRIGRRGVYPLAAANDIPAELIDRYFERDDHKVAVKAVLKQLILFSQHNIFQDPPFINIDLVSMRNLLIYFNPSLQEKVLNRLHYALRPRGVLFLGSSETIGQLHADFEILSDSNRLFRKRTIARRDMASRVRDFQTPAPRWLGSARGTRPKREAPPDIHMEMFEGLARSLGPNSVLVTGANNIIRVFGNLSDFIELGEETRLDLSLSLLKSPLREEAPSLCTVATKRGERRRGARHEMPGPDRTHVQLEAYPLRLPSDKETYTLLAIQQLSFDPRELEGEAKDYEVHQLRQLEADVASTREALQQTIEELQTANEEQQSLNEELQSSNEDLQATNEELETSNEELQSSNEELLTVNEELQINTTELEGVRRDLESILHSAPIAILVVDSALQILHSSAQARRRFDIADGLDNMHISQCSVPPGYPSLLRIASNSMQTREPQEETFVSGSKLVQIRAEPYFSETRDIRGVTLIATETESDELMIKMDMVEEMAEIAHWRLDIQSNQLSWSDSMYDVHGRSRQKGAPDFDTWLGCFSPQNSREFQTAIERTMATGAPFNLRLYLQREDGTHATVEARGARLSEQEGRPRCIVGVCRDINSLTRTEMLLDQFDRAQKALGVGFYSHDAVNCETFFSRNLCDLLSPDEGRTLQTLLGQFDPLDRDRIGQAIGAATSEGLPFEEPTVMLDGTDRRHPCILTGQVRRDMNSRITHVFGLLMIRQAECLVS